MLTASALALVLGFILDFFLGDPHGLWHPVQGIGWLITTWEKLLRRIFPKTPAGECAAGGLLVVLVIVSSLILPAAILFLACRWSMIAGVVVETVFCYQILAARSLQRESAKVADALQESLPAGQRAVSMIVGRDTERLDEEGVVKAAVETVAENTSDGIIAPMVFMALGGSLLGFFYKAVNTMDSMVGYKNEKYLYFGRAAARFDDLCNYIPARLSGILMIAAAWLLGFDGKNAAHIYRRDRRKHASPNSAHTEAVMAGALDIQLAGDAWYFGKLHRKDTIGDPIRPVEVADIGRSHRLMYGTAVLGLILLTGLRLLAAMLLGQI
ncbi:MAG: adenosylcobinamide-phosphate synthase CbiB [Lachnospiraceae bacterium]|nr:adenosylcobinamide-phosphate synthase CbiB [Lachnospiraceae bacterium]